MIERKKRLYRSRTDRTIAGVVGGGAQYLGLDPSLLRLAFVILVMFTGLFPHIFLYPALAAIQPLEPLAIALSRGGDYLLAYPSFERVAYVIGTTLAGFAPAVFAYLLMAITVPLEPKSRLAEAGTPTSNL
jgi:phage shock protein PspC (stress-responsive transcriptional regulator)